MAAFDLARLQPSLYDLTDPSSCLKFQVMVEDFMDVVRTNEAALEDHKPAISRFCVNLLGSDDAWQLAVNVVPEFRLDQYVL